MYCERPNENELQSHTARLGKKRDIRDRAEEKWDKTMELVKSAGTRDTGLKTGTVPGKSGRLVTIT